jgi:hypothetical protein
MDLQAKIIVTFVWGIIAYETTSFLVLYAPLLHSYNPAAFYLLLPPFMGVVSLLCVSYYKSIYCLPGHPSYHIVLAPLPRTCTTTKSWRN